MSFEQAKDKLTIGSLDNTDLTVSAQYNPKELQIDQNVPWKKPEAATKTGKQQGTGSSKDNPLEVEFTGAEGRTMTVEMLFDGYEPKGRAVDVSKMVADLTKMATVIDPESKNEQQRRPHHCVVSWGAKGILPRFECVIESLSTKYSMFSGEGEPLRATCTVKLKEAKMKAKK